MKYWLLSCVRVSFVSLCGLLSSCGGQAPAAAAPESKTEAVAQDSNGRAADVAPAAPAAAAPQACADESCAPCGDALCPAGFYCEEARSACAWVPECTGSFHCACLQGTLPGCSCADRDGKLYVTCAE